MKTAHKQSLLAALACAVTFATATQAQTPATERVQFPIPTTAAEVPGPAAGNTMTKAYVQII